MMQRDDRAIRRAEAALALALTLAAPRLFAQQPAPQQPAPKPTAPAESNPFPEDTSSVPVINGNVPDQPAEQPADEGASLALPATDRDPVRSPDDAIDEPSGETGTFDQGFSSSRSGLDSVLSGDEGSEAKRNKRRKPEPPPHVETAAEDLSVAKYYLSKQDWKAALSRYQSALVRLPEEPDVYWGLAESQRHLGDLAGARENYQKLIEYDPDSRHGKDAAKILKSAEFANLKAANPAAK